MGRHSVPDDYEDGAAAVLSTPASSTNRPLPGKHSDGERPGPGTPTPVVVEVADDADDDASSPRGLDMIETVMAGGDDTGDTGDIPVVTSGADPHEAEDHTAQIEPVVDPVLDEPLPVAVTTVIPPVSDDDPARRPSPQSGRTSRPDLREPSPKGPDDEPAPDEAPAPPAVPDAAAAPDKAADKAAAKAAKAEAKAAAKAAKAAAKAVAKPATESATKPVMRPEPRVSDVALLRTDSAARARVIAAVVVPFLLYVGVLFVLDAFDLRTVLIWIWVPLVSAGVVAGLLLDLAHRAAAARAIAALEAARDPSEAGR